jgi:glutamyl-tRNA synthetase
VIDDVGMKISHVIRAAEHLSNTPVQVLVYLALGAPMPLFAHVPVVNEPNSKKKLSKRDMKKFVTSDVLKKLNAVGWTNEQIEVRDDLNPATVSFYKELGYLPEGLVNYLARLGWSLDDHSEIILLKEMVAKFGLDRVNNAPASFDPDKLFWVAGEYMKVLPLDKKVEGALPFMQKAGFIKVDPTQIELETLRKVVDATGDRLKIFSDILPYGAPFFKANPDYDLKSLAKRVAKEGVPELLKTFSASLHLLSDFSVSNIETALKDFCVAGNHNTGMLIHALRVSTTGIEVGPGVFDCLYILGKEESLRRINLALDLVAK